MFRIAYITDVLDLFRASCVDLFKFESFKLLEAKIEAALSAERPLEKTTHEICHAVHALAPSRREKMLTKALVLTDDEAELLSRALEEVKTKTFEEFQISLDDLGALNALVSHFRDAAEKEPDKEAHQISVNPLSKRLFLGHFIGREGGTDTAGGSQ